MTDNLQGSMGDAAWEARAGEYGDLLRQAAKAEVALMEGNE